MQVKRKTTQDKETRSLIKCIAKIEDCRPLDVEELSYDHYGLRIFKANGSEYAIGTDSEADDACKANIKDSVWAFNPSFIVSECSLPYGTEDAIRALQDKCEGANEPILAMVKGTCGLDSFVESAISADGRGHFLASYDRAESEENGYYIYRIN
jgi:hypothetical protein